MFALKRSVLIAIVTIGLISLSILPLGLSRNAPRLPQEALNRFIIQLQPSQATSIARVNSWLQFHNFDVAGADWEKAQIEVITTDAGIQLLKTKGFNGRVIERRTPGTPVKGIDSRYLDPKKVVDKLTALHAAYPKLTRLEQIGTSHQGRPVVALLISTTPEAGDPRALEKPTLIADGMHHAREIMTPEIVMDIGETLLTASRTNARAQTLLKNWNIWIVPMLNVDGNNIVWTNNNWWRKNARADASNIHGVDLNRNYPYRWSGCNGSSGSKSSDTYRGPSAGSEPETLALVKLAEAVQPAASLSYHSYSELILYPFGCQGDTTSEDKLFASFAQELSNRLPTDSGSQHYKPGKPWAILYGVDGDSMDFIYAAFGALSFTFEVNKEFQPKYELREPTLKKHRNAWAYFLARANQNLLTIKVIDGKTGRPALGQIAVNSIPHKKGERPFKTNAAGYYFKILDPGTYGIEVTLADGRQAQAGATMEGKPGLLTVTVP